MTRVLEVRAYNLNPGTGGKFHALFVHEALPMLQRWKIDVVAFGHSLHDSSSFYLMRSYENLAHLERSEEAFYGSDEWRLGPREAILACIENYTSTVIEVDDATIAGLRRGG